MNPLVPLGILGAIGAGLLFSGGSKKPSENKGLPPPPPVKEDPKVEAIAEQLMAHLGGLMAPDQADQKVVLSFQKAHNQGANKGIIYLSENGKYDPLTSAALTLYTKKPIPGSTAFQPRPATVGEALSKTIGEGGSNAGSAWASCWNVAHGLEQFNLDTLNPEDPPLILRKLIQQFQYDVNNDPRFPGAGLKLSPIPPASELIAQLTPNGKLDRGTSAAMLKALDYSKFPAIRDWLAKMALPPAPPKIDPTIVDPPKPKPATPPLIVVPEAPQVPVPPPAETRIVVTNDPPPMGDLIIYDKPNGQQIGGAYKLGTVTLLQSNVDNTGFARIRWDGAPARPGLNVWPAATGFVREKFLKKASEVPNAPAVLPDAPKPASRFEGKALIKTKDPSPLGDLNIWSEPGKTKVGGASKNGEVTIIRWDTQYPGYAEVAWLGDSRYPSIMGYANKTVLQKI